jgi:DNA polymerase delta subunit 2
MVQQWISAPPPRQKYLSSDGSTTQTMLEDESGRLRLTGHMLNNNLLVTGCIVAVLGTENANGDFEVIEVRVPDLPRQPQRWERDDIAKTKRQKSSHPGNKIALISGLGFSSTSHHLPLTLLSEYLLGEAGTPDDDQSLASQISRLIIAGNSLASTVIPNAADTVPNGTSKKIPSTHHKKYGYDASAYNPTPTAHLDTFLAELLPSIPITLMPGDTDPANTSLPQQGVHAAMFPHARAYAAHPAGYESSETNWFDGVTNPWEGDVEGWRWMGNSGQPIDDILRYVDQAEGEGCLEVMESCLRWRCVAPTAPDTLCMSSLPSIKYYALQYL